MAGPRFFTLSVIGGRLINANVENDEGWEVWSLLNVKVQIIPSMSAWTPIVPA
jgi:hypothetical protein